MVVRVCEKDIDPVDGEDLYSDEGEYEVKDEASVWYRKSSPWEVDWNPCRRQGSVQVLEELVFPSFMLEKVLHQIVEDVQGRYPCNQ